MTQRLLRLIPRLLPALLTALLTSSAPAQSPGFLLVVTKQDHALAMVDGVTLQVVAHVPIGEDPHEVVVGPDHRTAFVSNYADAMLHTIARVDLVNRKPLQPFDVTPLRGVHGLLLHDDTLWFTAEGSKALGTLDPTTGKLLSVLGTGQDMTHLVWVSRDGTLVAASNAGSATISLFRRDSTSPSSALKWKHILVPVGLGAEGFAVSPDEHELWAGNADGTISVLDLTRGKLAQTLNANVPGANRLRFTPDGRLVLVTMHRGKDLAVFDAHTRALVKRIPIEENGASGIAIEPNGARAFIACPRDHFVAVVDLLSLTKTAQIDAGREPDGLTWWTP